MSQSAEVTQQIAVLAKAHPVTVVPLLIRFDSL
jgi:hypothetical protein